MLTITRPHIVNRAGDSCGPQCWYAKNPECKCCCGGANHGKANPQETSDGLPYRTKRVGDRWFFLAAAGDYEDIVKAAEALARPIKQSDSYGGGEWTPHLGCHRDFLLEAGIILERASAKQAEWPELADYTGDRTPHLLWAEC